MLTSLGAILTKVPNGVSKEIVHKIVNQICCAGPHKLNEQILYRPGKVSITLSTEQAVVLE